MKIVVVLSGGVDSTTLLYRMQAEGHVVCAVTFDYGQKSALQERSKSMYTCTSLDITQKIVDLSSMQKLINNSALTGDVPMPEGPYDGENMKATVVPARNLILASLAIGYASNIGADAIALGVHSGDHHIYPDCRPEFILRLRDIAKVAVEPPVKVLTPYLYYTKGQIVADGITLSVDYELTWSCYVGGKKPCGKCGTCVERAEAFHQNGIDDPLLQQWR
jgi:7-cyano-7-deazaguanine synthase